MNIKTKRIKNPREFSYPEDSDEELYWLSGYSSALDNYSRSFDM